ncbi:MAG: hypothetical protein V1494_04915 [Candidatus Diapherotrites archaeon]
MTFEKLIDSIPADKLRADTEVQTVFVKLKAIFEGSQKAKA